MSFDELSRYRVKLKPLTDFPGRRRVQIKSPFRAPFRTTMQTLARELKQLCALNIVIEVDINERELRLDGLPRATAKLNSPAVVISFDSKHGPLRVYFDKFTSWQHNIHAIALHLEHLRKASLYGVGTDGEQYRGWKAITTTKRGFPSKKEAAEFIAKYAYEDDTMRRDFTAAGSLIWGGTCLTDAFRRAAARLHPDTASGDHESFIALLEAKRMLEEE